MKFSITELTAEQLKICQTALAGGNQTIDQDQHNHMVGTIKQLTLENKQLKEKNMELEESYLNTKDQSNEYKSAVNQYAAFADISYLKAVFDEIKDWSAIDSETKELKEKLAKKDDEIMDLKCKNMSQTPTSNKENAKLLIALKNGDIEPLKKAYPGVNWSKRSFGNQLLHSEVR